VVIWIGETRWAFNRSKKNPARQAEQRGGLAMETPTLPNQSQLTDIVGLRASGIFYKVIKPPLRPPAHDSFLAGLDDDDTAAVLRFMECCR
jgi:hypothetical protein